MSMSYKAVVVVPPKSGRSGTRFDATIIEPVANRPIVCHVLDAVVASGINEIALVGPSQILAEIRACLGKGRGPAADVECFPQDGREDLLGTLAAAECFVGEDPCVVHFADGLLGEGLGEFLALHATESPDLFLLLCRGAGNRDRLGPAAHRVLGIAELDGSRTSLGLVGVCLFGPGAFRRACEAARADHSGSDLTAIAERLACASGALGVRVVRTWRRYCGDPLDLLELNRIVLDQQAPAGGPIDIGDNRIEGRVVIDPSADVTSSTILGPTIIGPSARVSDSWIGPYTSIGAGAEIEGAEIERSIISDGARIMHVGGRIAGSTVGRRASIFKDFSLPRAMRLHVGDGVELALN
jgi:glucose-1-phosphate thymidylyltransferase